MAKTKKEKVKLIIAGARDCTDIEFINEAIVLGIKELGLEHIDEIVSGSDPGVPQAAELWAADQGYNIVTMTPKWKDIKAPGAVIKQNKWGQEYNSIAGFQRNDKMAEYGSHLIVIDLNSGNSNGLIKSMHQLNKPVYEYTPGPLEDDEFEYDFYGELHASIRL